METNDYTEQLEARNKALERAFADAELRAQRYARDLTQLESIHENILKENHQLQHDYETMRIQKGGFGFKTMLLTGMIGTIVGIIFCYLFLRPKDVYAETFEKFKDAQQFNLERTISQGEFDKAEKVLKESAENPEYHLIKSEIQFTQQIVGAARRRCQ